MPGLDKPHEGLCSVIRNFSARARFLCIMARRVWGAGGGGQEASEIQIPPNLLAFACLHQFHFAKADLNSDPSGREEGAGSLGEKRRCGEWTCLCPVGGTTHGLLSRGEEVRHFSITQRAGV